MAAITICSDFGASKNKIWHCFHCFPIYFPWSDGTRCHDLRFWMLSFQPTFSLSSFTFIKKLFSAYSLSAIRVVSSAYLRLASFKKGHINCSDVHSLNCLPMLHRCLGSQHTFIMELLKITTFLFRRGRYYSSF